MKKRGSIFGTIFYIALLIILLILINWIYGIYQQNNFSDYQRKEYNIGSSIFIRDEKEKYDKTNSYKIESKEYNDALFCKSVEVKPHTVYKVTCMVKTKNVENEKTNTNAGANICIEDTVEKSKSITGTNDWQQLEFMFNSKSRETVDIGFRLGSYEDNSKGEVWFSDIKLEQGITSVDNKWKFGCFIIENINVTVQDEKNVKLSMTTTDLEDMSKCMKRFGNSMEELSNNKMEVEYDIIRINEPLTELSYEEENGYYVSSLNVEKLIDKYVEAKEYDHIFIAIRLGNMMHKTDIPVYDWIGLGSMDYYGIGFSNIRLPNEDNNYIYKYDYNINTFPEEVMVHEFLHSLERTCKEYGYQIPELHDFEKYNYENEKMIGLKKWYKAYMTATIEGSKGLNQEVYTLKPTHKSDFNHSVELTVFKAPENLIEEVSELIKNIVEIFKK